MLNGNVVVEISLRQKLSQKILWTPEKREKERLFKKFYLRLCANLITLPLSSRQSEHPRTKKEPLERPTNYLHFSFLFPLSPSSAVPINNSRQRCNWTSAIWPRWLASATAPARDCIDADLPTLCNFVKILSHYFPMPDSSRVPDLLWTLITRTSANKTSDKVTREVSAWSNQNI